MALKNDNNSRLRQFQSLGCKIDYKYVRKCMHLYIFTRLCEKIPRCATKYESRPNEFKN